MYLITSLSCGQRCPTVHTVYSRVPQYFGSITIVFFKHTTEFVVPNNKTEVINFFLYAETVIFGVKHIL